MRVKAIISYDGTSYKGFQKQKHTKQTVTSAIEDALHSLQIEAPIVGSGRTDSGVHATGQVIHFDLPDFWNNLEKLKTILNKKLYAIQFRIITKENENFHARFHAKKRHYRYLFKTSEPTVFERSYVAHYKNFNPHLLQKSLHLFCGEHDFLYFHKQGSNTHTTKRIIYHSSYYLFRDYHIISFTANGFLRSQVRMMIDAAMQCASEKIKLSELQEQIDAKKQYCTNLAPQNGLYLAKISY